MGLEDFSRKGVIMRAWILVAMLVGCGALGWMLLNEKGEGLQDHSPDPSGGNVAGPADEQDVVPLNGPTGNLGGVETAPFEPDEEPPEAAQPETPDPARPVATVVGRCVTPSGQPVPDAKVTVRKERTAAFLATSIDSSTRKTATTDKDGAFSLELEADPGSCVVTVQPRDRAQCWKRFLVEEPGEVSVGDLVSQAGVAIRGRLLPPLGESVSSFLVEAKPNLPSGVFVLDAMDRSPPRIRTTQADETGNFEFLGLEEGAWIVTLSTPGRQRRRLAMIEDLKDGDEHRLGDIMLEAGETLAGTVTDPMGMPLADVRVSLVHVTSGSLHHKETMARTRTDKLGNFMLRDLDKGKGTLVFSAGGFVKQEKNVSIPGDHVPVVLNPSPILRGHVTSLASGMPIEDFTVDISLASMPGVGILQSMKVLTGEETAKYFPEGERAGAFVITDVRPDALNIKVTADGYAAVEKKNIVAAALDAIILAVPLPEESVVKGKVTDTNGDPIAGARINAKPHEASSPGVRIRMVEEDYGPGQERVESDENGEFAIRGLGEGDFDLTATHPKWCKSAPRVISIGSSGVQDFVVLSMSRGGGVTGRILDSEGQPMDGARVEIGQVGKHEIPRMATSNTEGVFLMEGLSPGSYYAQIMEAKTGFGFVAGHAPPGSKEFQVREEQMAEVLLRCPPRGEVRGAVSCAGAPVADQVVELFRPDSNGFSAADTATTDANGEFLFSDVLEGEWKLSVKARGAGVPTETIVRRSGRAPASAVLMLPTGRLVGRVLKEDSTTAAEGLLVELVDAGANAKPRTRMLAIGVSSSSTGDSDVSISTTGFGLQDDSIRTDEDGNYEILNVPAGTWRINISGGGFVRMTTKDVELKESQRLLVDTLLAQKGATLEVGPLKGTRPGVLMCMLYKVGEDDPQDVRTATNEAVKFTGLVPGNYRAELSAPLSGLFGEQEVLVPAGGNQKIEIELGVREGR